MTSFFYQTAQSLINQYPDRFPLLKITHLLDWQAIEAKLQSKKNRPHLDNNGRPAYSLLPMFRAILLGQWHSLSDPELERSLVTRLDFVLFCQFPDETHLPDHSTLNRFRKRFKCKRASYFGLAKVKGQMLLKAICLNLLKAANKLRTDVPIMGESVSHAV